LRTRLGMLISPALKQLLELLADGRFHSGTELASALAISRSAVWKQLQSLAELGLELVAVSGKGYKLQRPLQLLDQASISAHLEEPASAYVSEIEIHDLMPSTNSYLLERAQHNAVAGLVCLAEYQSAGKGRRGRQWVSPFGHNIYLSILWRYQGGPGALTGLSLAVGVAVVRALRALGIQDVALKWPNDILWQQRKLAGILIEVSGDSSGPCHAVIGLGLNLYLPPQQAATIEQSWVDLQQILAASAPVGTQIKLERNHLVALLLNQLLPVIAGFETQGISDYLDEWRSYDGMQGKAVTLYIGQQAFHGTVQGIDNQGLLLLEDSDGQIKTLASGEVSFRAA